MRKIRILHVVQAAGGVDRYIRMLLKYLDKEEFENIMVCSQDFHKGDYERLADGFEQIEMNRAIGMSDLKSIREVRRRIKKYNPDSCEIRCGASCSHFHQGAVLSVVHHADISNSRLPHCNQRFLLRCVLTRP